MKFLQAGVITVPEGCTMMIMVQQRCYCSDPKGAYMYFDLTIEVHSDYLFLPAKFPGIITLLAIPYARSETTGEDEFFQFIIPKAKMQSEGY